MGTHPIFESDFDCLTEKKWHFTIRAESWCLQPRKQVSMIDLQK